MIRKLADDRVGHVAFTLVMAALFIVSMYVSWGSHKSLEARVAALEAKQSPDAPKVFGGGQ